MRCNLLATLMLGLCCGCTEQALDQLPAAQPVDAGVQLFTALSDQEDYKRVQRAIYDILQSGEIGVIDHLVNEGLKSDSFATVGTRSETNFGTEVHVNELILALLRQKVDGLETKYILKQNGIETLGIKNRVYVSLQSLENVPSRPKLEILDLGVGILALLCKKNKLVADDSTDEILKGNWVARQWARIRPYIFTSAQWPPMTNTYPPKPIRGTTRYFQLDRAALYCSIPHEVWVRLPDWEKENRTYAVNTGMAWFDWLKTPRAERKTRLLAAFCGIPYNEFKNIDDAQARKLIAKRSKFLRHKTMPVFDFLNEPLSTISPE